MPFLACLLFLFAYRDVNVLDQTFQVPPDDWRYVDSTDWRRAGVEWKERPGVVKAFFDVESGPPVRLMLLNRADLDSLKRGEAGHIVRRTQAELRGGLAERTGRPGDYVIVLENRGSPETAIVRLRVTLDSWDATQLTPERRLAVLGISFAVFFGLVSFSAIKLWRAANS
jgi:hypothetical protein